MALKDNELLQAIKSENPIVYLLTITKNTDAVAELIKNINHTSARHYLEKKLEEYVNGLQKEQEQVIHNVFKGQLTEDVMKRLLNLGLVTVAYRSLLNCKSPEDVVVKYAKMFENNAQELELLVENHIVRKALFEHPKDPEMINVLHERLTQLKEKTTEKARGSIEHVISDLGAYRTYVQDNAKHLDSVLGHHQLFAAFAMQNKDALLLEYATGAGKTWAAMQTIKTLTQKKPDAKVLIIAPLQAIEEGTWNEQHLCTFGLPSKITQVQNGNTFEDADILIVNYDKLPASRTYLDRLKTFAQNCDLLIIDEAHNIKKPTGEISSSVQELIEIKKPKRLILTATPVYNNEKDIGMLLYLNDPVRWKQYGNGSRIQFNYANTQELISLIELIEKGWWEFNRPAVKNFHNLPQLSEEKIPVAMHPEDADLYFEAYKDVVLSNDPDKLFAKAIGLERTAVFALINSEDFLTRVKQYVEQGYLVNIFSRLKDGIFDRLEENLESRVNKERIRRIDGSVPYEERIQIQQLLKHNAIDIIINQQDCSGEAFTEVASNRPVAIIPLLCPYSPGTLDQIIGRSYRPGQYNDVKLVFMIPKSNALKKRIQTYIDSIVRQECVYRRRTWSATLLAEDAHDICHIKMQNTQHLKKLHGKLVAGAEKISSTEDLIISVRKELVQLGVFQARKAIVQKARAPCDFSKHILDAFKHIGHSYHPNNFDDNLVKAYARPDVITTRAGEINLALAALVSRLKPQQETWTIGDYGSCTGVFAQARTIVNTLEAIVTGKDCFDHIVNIEGNKNAIKYSIANLREKNWLNYIKDIDKLDLKDNVNEKLKNPTYYDKLIAHCTHVQGNFVYPLVKNGTLDCAISSQALQYNNQKERRDAEKILLHINNALRMNGHLILYLIGKYGKANSITTKADYAATRKLVEAYGFELCEAGKLRAELVIVDRRIVLPRITNASYCLVAKKTKQYEDLVKTTYDQFTIYTGKKHVISGGYAKIVR